MDSVQISGKSVRIGRAIGKGGEGEVFALEGRSKEALKLYRPDLRQSREAKIRAMVERGLAGETDLVAFPVSVATDARKRFVGFVMRLVSGFRPLHELYSPKSRLDHFPDADYRHVVRTALNVSRAVGKVHQSGCVIGDLNHSGIFVSPQATVSLIDADSFQFQHKGRAYPCLVGVPEYTPPELQGKALAGISRTTEHDNFGLAIAIFHLLFMGRHPYAGVYKGPGQDTLDMGQAIARHRFAYSVQRQTQTQTVPPPGAPSLSMFNREVASAFERAFGTNPSKRPGASEWVSALERLEASLRKCSRSSAHYYPREAGKCLWCAVEARTGFDMFPPNYTAAPSRVINTGAIEGVIRELEQFVVPNLSALIPSGAAPFKPSKQYREAATKARAGKGRGLAVLVGSGVLLFAMPQFFYFSIIGGIVGWAMFAGGKTNLAPFRTAHNRAKVDLQKELELFLSRTGADRLYTAHAGITPLIDAYRAAEPALKSNLAQLKSTRKVRQLSRYLDGFRIRKASIRGVGDAMTSTLASFGIETAADVNREAVRAVPGFGPVKTDAMLDWRASHERKWAYNPNPTPEDKKDEAKVRAQHNAFLSKVEAQLRETLGELKAGRTKLTQLETIARADKRLQAAKSAEQGAYTEVTKMGGTNTAFTPQTPIRRKTTLEPPVLRAPKATALSTSALAGNTIGSWHAKSKKRYGTTRKRSPNCPRCQSRMVKKNGRYGMFWSCNRYPICSGSRNI